MNIRIPDVIYRALERVYMAQRTIRRRELDDKVKRQDNALRAYDDDLRARHDAETCGGTEAKCPYVPCRPRVSSCGGIR